MKMQLSIPDMLGCVVQQTRRGSGIKSEEIQQLLDCSAHHVSDIENGRTKPSYNALIAIVRFLLIDPNEFFYPERNDLDAKRLHLIHAIETCSDERVDILTAIWNGLPREEHANGNL